MLISLLAGYQVSIQKNDKNIHQYHPLHKKEREGKGKIGPKCLY